MNFSYKIIDYFSNLDFPEDLKNGFKILNPYRQNSETLELVKLFYKKYYSDKQNRRF
ncbi:MAG: DUF4918 family protein [Bacteroidales bacterium]|jgi:hypothetical protein|nr:SMUG2 DNA glycosylase family protein [Bacteroidales bacterium]MCK9499194.1 SMUG2 DNA glycosylase family protein [Bacteroidales bacterium]MDY0314677.1 DUF4918 family protein [Bacteroidales bacterium]NLB85579.1 DUF4918 family protein [Bacteroidales bacterium]